MIITMVFMHEEPEFLLRVSERKRKRKNNQ
jgi:hypothetical protein